MAVDAEPFLREPLHEAGRIGDFAAGFRERLALFGGNDRGEIVGMGDDQAVPFLENGTAIGGGARAPFGECRAGGSDRRDRKSVVEGQSEAVRVDSGGRRSMKKKKQKNEGKAR